MNKLFLISAKEGKSALALDSPSQCFCHSFHQPGLGFISLPFLPPKTQQQLMLLNAFHVILNNVVLSLYFGAVDQNCSITSKNIKIQFCVLPYKF